MGLSKTSSRSSWIQITFRLLSVARTVRWWYETKTKPSVICWIYTWVIEPIMTYATLVRWPNMIQPTTDERLGRSNEKNINSSIHPPLHLAIMGGENGPVHAGKFTEQIGFGHTRYLRVSGRTNSKRVHRPFASEVYLQHKDQRNSLSEITLSRNASYTDGSTTEHDRGVGIYCAGQKYIYPLGQYRSEIPS